MKTLFKKAILAIAIIVLITGGLFIVNINIDATDIPPPCERKTECVPNDEGQKPNLICPNPRQPCPLEGQSFVPFDITERSRTFQPCPMDTTDSRDNKKFIQEDR